MAPDQWKCPHCGNVIPTSPVSLEQDARVALLEHYTSQMQGYKVYLLTIVIGFFAGIEALRTLPLQPFHFVLLFSLGVGSLAGGIAYCIPKAFWFGQHVRDIIREDSDCRQTMLDQLDGMVHTKRGMVREDPWSSGAMKWIIKRGGCDSQLVVLVIFVCALFFALTIGALAAGGVASLGLKCGQCVCS
jgi:hypothetical protein